MTADEMARHLAATRCFLERHDHPEEVACDTSLDRGQREAVALRARGLALSESAASPDSLREALEPCFTEPHLTHSAGAIAREYARLAGEGAENLRMAAETLAGRGRMG